MMADKKTACVAYYLNGTGNVDGRKGSTMSMQEKNNAKNNVYAAMLWFYRIYILVIYFLIQHIPVT